MMNLPFIKSFIQYFVPIVLIVIVISTFLFELRNDGELHIIKSREVDTIQLIKSSFESVWFLSQHFMDTGSNGRMFISESTQFLPMR